MNFNVDKSAVHWIEVILATLVVGIILVVIAASVRTALTRERDAMRLAVIAATRGALEHYGATQGGYPRTEGAIEVSGGCIDTEHGIVSASERINCTATLFGIPSESRSSYGMVYQSTADGTGYALIVGQEHLPGALLCATPFGVALATTCSPVARTRAK